MNTLVAMARLFFLVLLTPLTLSLLLALSRPGTGVVERLIVVAIFVGCMATALRIASIPIKHRRG